MTMTAINLLSFGAVGEAFGAWCQRFTIKELMDMFGVAQQTATKWRCGKLPEPKHMVMMAERWEEDFLLTIFAPAFRRLDGDSLTRDLEVIETKVSLIRERIAHEQKRNHRLGMGAVPGLDGDGAPGRHGAETGELGQRSGRGVEVPGRAPARRRPVLGSVAGALMLMAASAPLADDIAIALASLFGVPVQAAQNDDDPARVPRRVKVARVRAGRGAPFA